MQHIWEFLCEQKAQPGMQAPEPINRLFVSESGRKNKVGIAIKKSLKKDFNITDDHIENLYIAKHR